MTTDGPSPANDPVPDPANDPAGDAGSTRAGRRPAPQEPVPATEPVTEPIPDRATEPAFERGAAPVVPTPPAAPEEYLPPPAYAAQPYPYGYQMQAPTNGMAIASLVTSCVMLVSCMPLSVIGAILGHIARRQIRDTGESGGGLALAGVIIGWIGLLLPVIFIAALVAIGAQMSSSP
jgi:hypothetical protein